MTALVALLEENQRADRYNDYVAVVQRGLLSVIAARSGIEIKLPEYIEYMYPETIKKESAEEIKAHILEQLTK